MLLSISFENDIPIYVQIYRQIVIGIASKRLQPNESLPSIRSLASDIGINLHTVNKAYTMLKENGYIVIDRRIGAAVAAKSPPVENVVNKLDTNLQTIAAEAMCHGMDKIHFLELCKKVFDQLEGE